MFFKFGRKLALAIWLFSIFWTNNAQAKSVLLVWSASQSQPWSVAISNALEQELEQHRGEYTLYQEYLNSDQLTRKPNNDLWVQAINDRYRNESIDLILSIEAVAGELIVSTRDTLLPGTPRLTVLGPPNNSIMGITNTDQPSNQLDAIYSLLPDLQKLLYVSSLPGTKRGVQQEITSAVWPFEIELLDDQLSYAELLQRLSNLPVKSAVIYGVMHQDNSGIRKNPARVLREIQSQVEVPIFVDFATLMLPGIVGGHMLDGSKIARQVAQLILGEPPSNQALSLGQLRVDFEELKRWNIPLTRLPEGAKITNQPLPLSENYRTLLIYTGIALILAVALASTLFFALRLRTTRLKLIEIKNVQTETALEQERKLNEVNQTAALATYASGIGTFKFDPVADRVWPSQIAAKILELIPDKEGAVEELSRRLLERIHPDDRQSLRQYFHRQVGGQKEITYRLLNAKGQYRWIQSVSQWSEGAQDEVLIGILRDITEEKLLNDRLYLAQQRMTTALDAANIDLFEVNLNTGKALLLVGTSGSYQTGDTFQFVEGLSSHSIPSHTRMRISEELQREKQRIEYTLRSIDGKALVWHQLSTGLIYTREGQRFITVARSDITPIRQQQHLAEQNNQENLLALAATGGGVARIAVKTGRTWMSPRAQQIWDIDSLNGGYTSLFALTKQHHPDDEERVREEFKKVQVGLEISPIEYRIKLNSGHYRWIRAHATQYLDIQGNPEILAVFYDINEAKQNIQELIDSRERQSRLFAIIGHELRTPIATIQMMLDEQKVYDLEPFGKQLHQTMQHTLSVLDDLRAVTQPQQQKAQESPAVVYDLLEQTLGSLQTLLQTKGIRAHFLTDTRVQALCLFDRQALRQMVTNLLKNSALHSGATDLWLSAEATEIRDSRLAVTISIADNGMGIPADKIEQLFEAFTRGNTEADGTGLGLHICRNMAQQLGGTLTYQSSPQGGAMFIFNGSFNLAPQLKELDSQSGEAIKVNSTPLKGKKILYAEDQKTLQLLTLTLLKKQGAEVVVADDGVHALELYQSNQPFDLVLTDIMMPRLDGNGLTRALRERGYQGQIVGLTAATIGLETDALIESGADIALSKPVDIKMLVNLMNDPAVAD